MRNAHNKGVLCFLFRFLPFFPACCHRQISTFRERQRLSPPFSLSLAPRTQMRGFHFPFAVLLPPPSLTTPFSSVVLFTSVDVRSFGTASLARGPEATLVLRVTNPRFFRSFFRTKISTFQGETRTRSGGYSENGGERERER